jgi:hypothetical protein
LALVCTVFVPGLITVPYIVVAINGVVIIIYIGRCRYTHCLAAFDSLVGPDSKPIAVAFALDLHLQRGIVAISCVLNTCPWFCFTSNPPSGWPCVRLSLVVISGTR